MSRSINSRPLESSRGLRCGMKRGRSRPKFGTGRGRECQNCSSRGNEAAASFEGYSKRALRSLLDAEEHPGEQGENHNAEDCADDDENLIDLIALLGKSSA